MRGFPECYYSTIFDFPDGVPGGDFAIITAFNPMDRAAGDAENAAADEALRGTLAEFGLPHRRAIGSSPDDSHAESGWAVETTRERALSIAREFDQRALWWIVDGRLALVRCSDGHAETLGCLSERTR
ncbi:DUF3293 domain-containing protein [Haloferula helveola]|uniref:DUF3293 domain-containing protein n=1 Tax=Haloferula helveola TaxID=490095 RepID=A0ABM7RHY5_9BACT|nr:DUF3293 domain-containing protein [Haloferula helveola]